MDIEKVRKEKEIKIKRFYEAEEKKEVKRSKRRQRLTAAPAPALEEGSSQEMD